MMCKKPLLYIALLLSIMLMSCVTNRNTRYLQHIKGVKYSKVQPVEYKIKKGDELYIMVYTVNSNASLFFISGSQNILHSYSYLVYPDGSIDIPYVHKIKVEGLTLKEANSEIESRLKDYILDVQVKISLANKNFYILGEGARKGEFPVYKERLTIFEALAMAGDLNFDANRKKVNIIREIDGKKTILEFDLRSDAIVDSEYYYIQPNDIIYISRSRKGFYKITSFSSFLGMLASSLTFVLLVTNYSN